MNRRLCRAFAVGIAGALAACSGEDPPAASESTLLRFRGVNLAGAEFGENNLPGTFGTDYTYPSGDEVRYFVGEGMNTVRLPFRWERLQPTLGAAFDPGELSRLTEFVAAAKAQGATVVLDPHNYARYHGTVIGQDGGTGGATVADFTDLWSRLAVLFGDDPAIVFGLMNEPYNMPTEDWLAIANAGLAAIRNAGAGNLVLVPGNAWTSAHSWFQDWYGTPNADVMAGVVDPADNFAFEIHQYLDPETRGVDPSCQHATAGSALLSGFTGWARGRNVRAFLAEFAGGDNPTCRAAVTDLLDYLGANDDVWIGWTWWAAGPWWGDYWFSLEPDDAVDAPQMSWLAPYLH